MEHGAVVLGVQDSLENDVVADLEAAPHSEGDQVDVVPAGYVVLSQATRRKWSCPDVGGPTPHGQLEFPGETCLARGGVSSDEDQVLLCARHIPRLWANANAHQPVGTAWPHAW